MPNIQLGSLLMQNSKIQPFVAAISLIRWTELIHVKLVEVCKNIIYKRSSTHEISQSAHKLVCTPPLIHYGKKNHL